MKLIITQILLLSFTLYISAQTYNLDGDNNVSTCNATLYDSGGSGSDYSNGEDFSYTFCSTNGDCIEISFTSFDLEENYDYLYIYDGTDSNAPLLASLTGNTLPGNITSSADCITIRITSDGSVTHAGFELQVSCTGNCYVPPPPPTNNDPCSATELTVETSCNSITATTQAATNSSVPAPSCASNYNGGDVWFKAVVPASGRLEVDLTETSPGMSEAGITLYTGTDCNNLTEYSCDEAWGTMPSPQHVLSINQLAGDTIWIRVWEPGNDNQGAFDICAFEPDPGFEVDTTIYTPEELVEDILVTGCLEAFNVQYTGSPRAIGYFKAEGTSFDFTDGVILTSGDATIAMGENDIGSSGASNEDWANPASDSDLEDLSGVDIHDAAILEFDFIPSSDTIRFKYIFASEEYDEFVCGTVNDAFGFFISGPGITGPYTDNSVNIALVPNTTIPVSINTVNNGSVGSNGDESNCDNGSSYYLGNSAYYQGDPFATFIQYDGFTVQLEAVAILQACETYHIKLKIGDGGDASYDSAVMFEAASFSSGGDLDMSNYSSYGQVNEIYEGCENYWVFNRIDTSAEAMQDTLFIDLILSGTAIENTDFTLDANDYMILPGEYSDTLFYSAIWDDIADPDEYIVFGLVNGCPCSSSTTSDTIWIRDNFSINPVISNGGTICQGESTTIFVTPNPLQDPSLINYQWNNGATTQNITVSPLADTTYMVTVSSVCQADSVVSTPVHVIPPADPGFAISKDSICIGEDLTITYTGLTQNAQYTWTFDGGTPSNANGQGPHQVQWSTQGTKNITLLVNDNGCTDDSTITVFVSPNPQVTLDVTNNLCSGDCNGQIQATAQDNFTPYTYQWQDGQTTNPATNLCDGDYSVTFTNRLGCTGTATATVESPNGMEISVSGTDVSCFGGNDGSATVTINGGTSPYTYNWFTQTGLVGNTVTVNNLTADKYYVLVNDANNCSIIDSIIISQPDSPLVSQITKEDARCYGEASGNVYLTPLGGTPPYTYLWSNGSTTRNLTGVPAGMYSVQITDVNGCTGTNQIQVNQPSEIVNNNTSTVDNVCWGDNQGQISINISGGLPPYSYQWSGGVSDNSNTVDSLYAGIYTVTVTDTAGCTLVVSGIEIEQPNKLVVSINNAPTICIGQTATLISSVSGGTPPYSYLWSTFETSSSINVSPTDTNSYSLEVTDVNDCKASTETQVNVYPPISVELTASAEKVCPGDPVTLITTATGGNGNYTYLLNNYETIQANHIVYPQSGSTYTVHVSDNCGSPEDEASVFIDTYPLPSLSFTSDKLDGCEPLTVQFLEQSPDSGQTYFWQFGDNITGEGSTDKNPVHVYEHWGTYNVSLEVSSVDGCKNFLEIPNMITVYKKPVSKFASVPQTVSIIKPEVHFYNQSQDNYYNYWNFGDGRMSQDVSPTHIFPAIPDKNYYVSLTVESEHGCKDSSATVIVVENEYTMYVPTAFSPDGDNINDEFKVQGNGIDLDKFKLRIYNRWGEIIWETTDMSKGWDGKSALGNYVEPGVYTWLIDYTTENGLEFQKSGTVTLIR